MRERKYYMGGVEGRKRKEANDVILFFYILLKIYYFMCTVVFPMCKSVHTSS